MIDYFSLLAYNEIEYFYTREGLSMFNKERARNAREVFASNLRNCLAQAHKNQIDVANDLGITASTVSDWYNGKKYPQVDGRLIHPDSSCNVHIGIAGGQPQPQPFLQHCH